MTEVCVDIWTGVAIIAVVGEAQPAVEIQRIPIVIRMINVLTLLLISIQTSFKNSISLYTLHLWCSFLNWEFQVNTFYNL